MLLLYKTNGQGWKEHVLTETCKIETYDWNDDGSVDVAVTDFGGNSVTMFKHPHNDMGIYDRIVGKLILFLLKILLP